MEGKMKVVVGVHERLDAPGYVVKLTVGEGAEERVQRIPVDDRDEAEALARSLHGLAESPGSEAAIMALMGDAPTP